jgi:hypothetical protein
MELLGWPPAHPKKLAELDRMSFDVRSARPCSSRIEVI